MQRAAPVKEETQPGTTISVPSLLGSIRTVQYTIRTRELDDEQAATDWEPPPFCSLVFGQGLPFFHDLLF